MTQTPEKLRQQLDRCPPGRVGWKQFEDLGIETLSFLFVPPLAPPIIQPRTFSGIDRRDAVFPNRNRKGDGHWGILRDELDARLVLFEFKNYDTDEIGKEEVNQTFNYLGKGVGRLAILVCNKIPTVQAHQRRNTLYSNHDAVILFLTAKSLKEMLYMKERGQDPADLIMDAVERFYLQHE